MMDEEPVGYRKPPKTTRYLTKAEAVALKQKIDATPMCHASILSQTENQGIGKRRKHIGYFLMATLRHPGFPSESVFIHDEEEWSSAKTEYDAEVKRELDARKKRHEGLQGKKIIEGIVAMLSKIPGRYKKEMRIGEFLGHELTLEFYPEWTTERLEGGKWIKVVTPGRWNVQVPYTRIKLFPEDEHNEHLFDSKEALLDWWYKEPLIKPITPESNEFDWLEWQFERTAHLRDEE